MSYIDLYLDKPLIPICSEVDKYLLRSADDMFFLCYQSLSKTFYIFNGYLKTSSKDNFHFEVYLKVDNSLSKTVRSHLSLFFLLNLFEKKKE